MLMMVMSPRTTCGEVLAWDATGEPCLGQCTAAPGACYHQRPGESPLSELPAGVGILRKYGKGFAVAAIAIIFGLVHGNIVQFIFASLIGVILGYVTVKTDNILPAIFIHAFNNGMSVLVNVLKFATGGKDVDQKATVVVFLFWLVFGAVCTVILTFKKELKREERVIREPYANSFGQKLSSFFFVPAMIVPFGFFAFSILSTIMAK